MAKDRGAENPQLPFRSTLEQEAADRSAMQRRVSRRWFLGASATAASGAAGVAVLAATGNLDKLQALVPGEHTGPTTDQERAFKQLVVERADVINDLVLLGVQGDPSKLRNRPYVPRYFDKPVGKKEGEIEDTICVGGGIVVTGNSPTIGEKDPWIAILNPNRDLSKVPTSKDVVFSHYGNFQLTDDQRIRVLQDAERLFASK